MHLPSRVAQRPGPVGVQVVAGGLALRPVAHVVQAHHAERPGHPMTVLSDPRWIASAKRPRNDGCFGLGFRG